MVVIYGINGIKSPELQRLFAAATLKEKQYIIAKLQSSYTEEQVLEEFEWESVE